MAELPNIEFPPSMDEIKTRPTSIAETATADSLKAFSLSPHETHNIPYADATEEGVDVDGQLIGEASAGNISPTPNPNSPDPAPNPIDGLHVTPVNGTLEFAPAFDEIDNLVDVWYLMHPDIPLYPWQKEELLRTSGYINGTLDSPRIHYTPQKAYRGSYCCANGSGKDLALISTIAVGLPLLYLNVIVVITSASYEQLKFQTENHIKRGIASLHARLGGLKVYDSIEFYHKCEKRGGEIKLFVTDEGKRAEGWHPMHPSGRLVLIVNEAKSIPPDVFTALDRCDGYSHWLEISSPGPREGLFYENFLDAVKYPNLPEPGKFFARKVDQRQCPHKSEESRLIMKKKHGEFSYVYQTSVEANFWELETDVCVPAILLEKNKLIVPRIDYNDIGIGLDSAAGRDENALFVRAGAACIYHKFFVQQDTEATADIIDAELNQWRRAKYTFKADDGGVSRGICDKLKRKGWDVSRCLNQSAAHNKQLYLNLGAEMYFHVTRLLELGLILPPFDETLRKQLTTRQYSETLNQGKKALQSKRELTKSPDRADGYVLCYYSYRPPELSVDVATPEPERRMMTIAEFIAASERDPDFIARLVKQHSPDEEKQKGDFTFQTIKI